MTTESKMASRDNSIRPSSHFFHPNASSFLALSMRVVGKREYEFVRLSIHIHTWCQCVFSSHPFWTSMDVPAGVTQEEGHTGFLIHLPSAVRALIFVARRIQPFLSLVDREVKFCVLTN